MKNIHPFKSNFQSIRNSPPAGEHHLPIWAERIEFLLSSELVEPETQVLISDIIVEAAEEHELDLFTPEIMRAAFVPLMKLLGKPFADGLLQALQTIVDGACREDEELAAALARMEDERTETMFPLRPVPAAAGDVPPDADPLDRLAFHLSAAMRIMEMPNNLFDSLAAHFEHFHRYEVSDPAFIKAALINELADQKDEEEKAHE